MMETKSATATLIAAEGSAISICRTDTYARGKAGGSRVGGGSVSDVGAGSGGTGDVGVGSGGRGGDNGGGGGVAGSMLGTAGDCNGMGGGGVSGGSTGGSTGLMPEDDATLTVYVALKRSELSCTATRSAVAVGHGGSYRMCFLMIS